MGSVTKIKRSSGRTTFKAHELLFNKIARGLPKEFPFRSVFSLKPIIDHWQTQRDHESELIRTLALKVEQGVKKAPALADIIEDFELLSRHEEIVSTMLTPIFPNREWTNDLRALVDPFGNHMVFRTSAMQRLMRVDEYLSRWLHRSLLGIRILCAYRFILQAFYDTDLQVDQPIIQVFKMPDDLLKRYYKLTTTIDYVRVRNLEPVPDLGQADLHFLLNNVDNIGLWMECLPPQIFEFSGFQIVTMTDVTSEVATASIEHLLLTSDASVNEQKFDLIQDEIRTFFRKPFLRLGLASLQKDGELNFMSSRRIWNSLIIREDVMNERLDINNSIYREVLEEDRPIIVGDVETLSSNRDVRECLLDKDVHSLLLSPLRYEDEVVGILELSSRTPGDLNALATLKLDLIESLFALSVHQNLKRFEDRVTATVRESFTAIHPSVSWRFREAAIAMMDLEEADTPNPEDHIVFREVYPLYGSADIRGSSDRRNQAVRSDLIEHLELVWSTLKAAEDHVPVSLIGEIMHRIGAWRDKLKAGFHTKDESETNDFLVREVNPFLILLQRRHQVLHELIEGYFDRVNENGGLLINEQRAYGRSVQLINETISDILENEQIELQQTCPHYFEKYKTDGVEHTMYIGASIVPDLPFDLAYVKNLRLHQLITCCKIGVAIEGLKQNLEVPLNITQLILVQDMPHSISFRMDEKKFDVDGAYGIRYEVIKKRIDKAMIAGSEERISQPGKIAIVYAFDREAEEYHRYLDFMQADNLLVGQVEELEIGALQGVSGLKALRVQINMDRPTLDPSNSDSV